MSHNRTDVLNHLIKRWRLKSYLELGTQVRAINFDKIECENKFCVDIDPTAQADFTGSTDDFFHNYGNDSMDWPDGFDLIFIDASHIVEQVEKDFENALEILSPNGFIVLHDCNPLKEEHTIVPRPTPTGHWHGDVYKFAACMPKYPFWTVDTDCGCMVVRPEKDYFNDGIDMPKYIDWKFFDANRKELLNLISFEDFTKL